MGHSQVNTLTRNKQHANSRVYPELVMTPTAVEQEAAYYAALELVARIDDNLTRGTRHYRNKAGVLLTTLDEVVHAILENDLILPEAQGKAEIIWETSPELAA